VTNRDGIVDILEGLASIDERYENLQCVNYQRGVPAARRGAFSLVFQARDKVTGETVVIKTMDPDYLGDAYRLKCFDREPEIISRLEPHPKCLRLIQGKKEFQIALQVNGMNFNFPIGFFVTEWLAEDIEDYFVNQKNHECVQKLLLFRQLVLAVSSIHSQSVHHRDLKRDNLRVRVEEGARTVVAIDFGTAARIDSQAVQSRYDAPVGHYGYSPPEAFAGFAGERELGHLSDVYALGGMLYELFMPGHFFADTIQNPVFQSVLYASVHKVIQEQDLGRRLVLWRRAMTDFSRAVQPPTIMGFGSSLHDCVKPVIALLYSELAAFDLTKRIVNLDRILRRLDGAILAIQNERFYHANLAKRRNERDRKRKDAEAKEIRLMKKFSLANK
jgi:serine/threonine protein kinase